MEQSTRKKIIKEVLEGRKKTLEKEKNYQFAKEVYIKYLAMITAYEIIEEITDEESNALKSEAEQILAKLEAGLPRHK